LLGIPVVLDMVALATPRLINVIYAPLGVAAFAVGSLFVFEQRFLAVRNTGQDDQAAIFLSEDGQIRDVSAAAVREFPALEGTTGERFADVLPAVARVLESDDQIAAVGDEDEDGPRYYLVSPTKMTIGDSVVRVVSLTDVTEIERQRRRLIRRERELNERNELYRAVIAASFAFVTRIDRDGRINYVSPSVEEVIGYTPEELDSEPIRRVHPNDETTAQAREYLDEVLTGQELQVRDFPLETKMGRTVYTDVRIVPIYEASVPADERTPDDIVGAQTMIRDATARRRREGLISVTNRVLRHNVRNEMTVVNGYAEMLADQLDGDAASKAERIVETADRLLAISESARRIEENRDQSPELDAVDVVPLIDRLVTQLEDRHWDAAVTVDAPDAAVAETLPRLETALWEILENAAKHGGDPASVEVTVATTDHQVVISIKDDGPGLPDDERTVLAAGAEEPLVHGQGLGLWLAYYLVTNLRGEIEVPETRRGTTVEVRLPRSDA
jgi:PAS domain S-box-containing protein